MFGEYGIILRLLKSIAKENEAYLRLVQVPDIGIMTATILLTVAGVASSFKNGREFAAYLGLVPRQNSTGGKTGLLGISKRGDRYTRTLLIHGARAALYRLIAEQTPEHRRNPWIVELAARRGKNRASVALANKTPDGGTNTPFLRNSLLTRTCPCAGNAMAKSSTAYSVASSTRFFKFGFLRLTVKFHSERQRPKKINRAASHCSGRHADIK